MLYPCHPAVCRATSPAEQQATKCIFAAVVTASAWRALLSPSTLCAATCNFKLHGIKYLTADDPLMVVLNQIHRTLSCVRNCLFADAVVNECLLHKNIATILFIREDRFNGWSQPVDHSRSIPISACGQPVADTTQTLSCKV